MLRIKKYTDGIRLYGYLNCNDYILITEKGFKMMTSAPCGFDEAEIGDLLCDIDNYFNVNSFQELCVKCSDLVYFNLDKNTEIENFDEKVQELIDDGDLVIDLNVDKEVDDNKHIQGVFEDFQSKVNFKIDFKVQEFKSKQGYIKSRSLYIKAA